MLKKVRDNMLEAPDDPEFRQFMDQRFEQRKAGRRIRPPAWHNDLPTPKQLAYLRVLGHRAKIKTKGEAAKAIEELVGPKK